MIVQETNGRLFVTIPREKAIRRGIKKGDVVDWDFNERGNLELTKIEVKKDDK